MKRSEINRTISNAIKIAKEHKFLLPPFAYLGKEQLLSKMADKEYAEIFDNKLGWDITDFGSGDFNKIGLTMFTLRNGNYFNKAYTKPYAEKILITEEEQVTPYHYHALKMEDIINRGGGNLIVKLFNAESQEKMADTDVLVSKDGRNYYVQAGEAVTIKPGESISLLPKVFHSFWAEKGSGYVFLGEVSHVNDDYTDNNFYSKVGRFPLIEEDELPEFLLLSEYDNFYIIKK